jgi:hypothetical protein
MDERCGVVAELVDKIVNKGAVSAMRFMGEKEVVRATRRRYKIYKAGNRKDSQISIVVSIGKPNYLDRALIKKTKKNGGALPWVYGDTFIKWANPDKS